MKLSKKQKAKKISNSKTYELTLKEIDTLMKRDEANLSPKELEGLRIFAEAAEDYEDNNEPLPVPFTRL